MIGDDRSDLVLPKIRIEPQGTEIEFDPERPPLSGFGRPGSILDILLSKGIDIDHVCGGNCSCTTCHVIVERGAENLSEIREDEDDRLDLAQGLTPTSRLGCQAIPRGDVTIRIVNNLSGT